MVHATPAPAGHWAPSSHSAPTPFSAAASGLKVALLDESGQPAAHEVAGKVTLSWRSGSKKVTWGAQASTATPGIKLPPAKVWGAGWVPCRACCWPSLNRGKHVQAMAPALVPYCCSLGSCTAAMRLVSPPQMPESVAEVSNHWVRFTSADPPLVLEAAVQMQAVPADPAIWTLRCSCAACMVAMRCMQRAEVGLPGRQMLPVASGLPLLCGLCPPISQPTVLICRLPFRTLRSLVDQLTSQHAEELGAVQCGQPFALEVEALDAFNNRCVEVGLLVVRRLLSTCAAC